MSDSEAGSHRETPDGDTVPDSLEYAAPLSAIPPKVIHQEESQAEVSASPAFQCLDEVCIFLINIEI